jgi:long-chain acyl-CoA synthetase
MAAHRVTVMAAVPTMYQMMLSQMRDKSYDLSAIRICHSGAAAMPVALIEQIELAFGAPVQEGYGLSEATSIVCSNPLLGDRKPGTVGPAIPGVSVSVRDEAGTALPTGAVGELWVSGPTVMAGYWDNPVETERVLTSDGWLKTGDAAKMDEDGYVTIVDRLDDMMKVGGVKVYPREVEEVLYQHPQIEAVAVVGRPSHLYHQEVHAFVVLRPGTELTLDEVHRFCDGRLAAYKIPKHLHCVDVLPKGPTGKLMRRMLKPDDPLD